MASARKEVCTFEKKRWSPCIFLRKGGLSPPPTEDVRRVEAARRSSEQLWWPAFLMPCVV